MLIEKTEHFICFLLPLKEALSVIQECICRPLYRRCVSGGTEDCQFRCIRLMCIVGYSIEDVKFIHL